MDTTVNRQRLIAVVRIAFGLAWTVDAILKWLPGFVHGSFLSTMQQARAGQPSLVRDWITLWINFVAPTPAFWAYVLAAAETAVAICVVLGAFTNLVCVTGGVLSFVIWTAGEGLGGPYTNGTTDVGASIMYIFVFALLALTSAGAPWALDTWLRPRIGSLAWACARTPDLLQSATPSRTAGQADGPEQQRGDLSRPIAPVGAPQRPGPLD